MVIYIHLSYLEFIAGISDVTRVDHIYIGKWTSMSYATKPDRWASALHLFIKVCSSEFVAEEAVVSTNSISLNSDCISPANLLCS